MGQMNDPCGENAQSVQTGPQSIFGAKHPVHFSENFQPGTSWGYKAEKTSGQWILESCGCIFSFRSPI
jgi:hypothetical protein